MRVFCLLLGLCMLVTPVLSYGDEGGTVSVFVFKDGQSLNGIEVVVDGEKTYRTDNDGGLKVMLTAGKHQVEIFGKDSLGKNLGYFKEFVEVKAGKDTQLIATFDSYGEDRIDIDTPLDGRDTSTVKSYGTGTFSGIVLSDETNEPIPNARILVKGTAVDSRTGEDGRFTMEVPAGVPLSVSIIHSEYASQTLEGLSVDKEGEVTREVTLTPASVELPEFVVLAPKIKGSIASVVQEERQMTAITNILSEDEMGKMGDSDAAGALKRVTGVTLIGGQSVYVRGLGDRYSSIEMNSMPLPSPNPLKRTVPMDIFPASAISSMKIQKSAAADIPSNFGGGYIDVRTKEESEEDFFRIKVGGSGNSNTGNEVNSYEGSDTDWLGFDDGYREIDADILSTTKITVGERVTGLTTANFTKEELSQMTQDYLSRNYEVVKEEQPFGVNVGVEGSKTFRPSDRHEFTFYGFYTYDNDASSSTETYNNYAFQKATGKLYEDPEQTGENDIYSVEYVQNAMVNLGYSYGDALALKYTKLYTHNAEDTTLVVDGILGSNNEDMTRYYLNWEERTLDVDQINGTFDYSLWGHESNVRFGIEKAAAKLYQPNNFQYTYRNEGEEPFLDNKISNSVANRLESDDDLMAFYLRNKYHFNLFSSEDAIDVGISMSSKDRVSTQSKFYLRKIGAGSIVDDQDMTGNIEDIYDTYVRDDIDYDDRSLLVSQLFKAADYYDAEVDETALYLSLLLNPLRSLEFVLGARYVDFSQVVYQYEEDRTNPDMSLRRLIAKVPYELSYSDIHPSLSLKYTLNDNNIFDLALSQTSIAPDLREFTSGSYYHPYEVATIVGNPELVNTDIYSADLKYGLYFSDAEYVKFGGFYKYLEDPIEDVMMPSSSLPIYSFDNADNAILYGLEIDGRKGLSFLMESLRDFYLSGNFSIIESDVTLREEQETTYSTNHRDLQGLSPYVINVTLGYEGTGRSVTLSYNKMGKRIRKVGMIDDGDSYPDHYEDPAAVLDFVWRESFNNGLGLSAKIGNILKEETIWTQGSRVTKSYEEPTTYSVGLSYTWK